MGEGGSRCSIYLRYYEGLKGEAKKESSVCEF